MNRGGLFNIILISCSQVFSLFDECSTPFSGGIFNELHVVDVVNGCRHSPLLLVRDLADCATKDLATSCLGELFHDDDANETRKSTNISANFTLDLLLESILLVLRHDAGSFALQDDESKRALTSDLFIVANDGAFDNFFVIVDDFFEASC